MTEATPARARRGESARRRRRSTVTSVIGELLITVGVIALLFVAWQMWIGDMIIGAQKHTEAAAFSEILRQSTDPDPADPAQPSDPAEVPVLDQPAHGEQFGVMFVPRFGGDWKFTIAGGTTRTDILDQGEVGHYDDTAMPGELGNTVYAAHRWTSGQPFDPIDKLVVGDAIVIQTRDGWYTYRFRNVEYVQATQVQVLAAVPQRPELAADGRYLTLTSCAPKWNMRERIIAYAVFDGFTPAAAGEPAALTEGSAT